ncbi:adenosylcobinamide-GDP ribazoletransferase [Alkalihalobacterium chitinilyticum]|uniref:Adenosylcobinamide-GDP ribazoletransferase n=1 Tax=Alkalihalobacterium chitinilyticum TaxID=2980103 RepID=A0ABT5VA56_9BACI|nr:adenosylcobinamide-GDP ribazoletransferase [Alkalihalobacterium chitinilyticum]MDE5411991.1 adenosylcobinamide-GDP ribazoletransferase [Alkalihalobacterium chitinilyticum]
MDKQRKFVLLDGLILALQLLTTIPIRKQVAWTTKTASMSVALYPFIGLILGSIVMITSMLLIDVLVLPATVSSFLLLLLIVSLTGGLHLDGWMDVSDGFFSRQDQERKLEIMKDSRVGAFAVISLFFLLAGKYIFIYQVIESTEYYWFYFLIIPFLSRWMMTSSLLVGRPARKDGMAYSVQQSVHSQTKFSLLIWGPLLLISIYLFFPTFFVAALLLSGATIIILVVSFSFFNKQFGGITGDTLGTLVEGGEWILWLVAWLLLFYGIA